MVIGILLALQVNNWNNEKERAELQHIYIGSLINELKIHDEDYQRVISRWGYRINAIEKFFETLNTPNTPQDSIEKALDSVEIFLGFAFFQTTVYEELKQSGDLQVFDKNLREQIINYYSDLDTSIKGIDLYSEELKRWREHWIFSIDYAHYKGVKFEENAISKDWRKKPDSHEMMLATNFFLKRLEMMENYLPSIKRLQNHAQRLTSILHNSN